MAEEQKWQEATNHVPCANNCEFFGSPTTLNLCSKCYKNHCVNERPTLTAKIPTHSHSQHKSETSPSERTEFELRIPSTGDESRQRRRCGSCRKGVGLTGFTCRCGTTFCGSHRYPEEHECSFDFKRVGKEAIAKANPVVKGAKLEKI